VHGDDMPSGLDLCLFDAGVNQGQNTAIKMLQDVLIVKADGLLGPKTMAALAEQPLSKVIKDYCRERSARYCETKNFPLYGKGWLRRAEDCQAAALALLP
jgi:lysozyme family protein